MLDQEAFTNITALLLPHTHDLAPRRALVARALFNCRVLNGIIWEGDAQTFTVTLIKRLHDFGECAPNRPALVMLLETLKEDIGANHHARIDSLIAHLLVAPLNSAVTSPQTRTLSGEKTSEPNTMIRILRDPAFQAITAVIGILLAIVAIVLSLAQPNNEILTSTISVSTPTMSASQTVLNSINACEGQIIVSSASGVSLDQVKALPQQTAPKRPPIKQGSIVTILSKQKVGSTTWYEITYLEEVNRGWINATYVDVSQNCSL